MGMQGEHGGHYLCSVPLYPWFPYHRETVGAAYPLGGGMKLPQIQELTFIWEVSVFSDKNVCSSEES